MTILTREINRTSRPEKILHHWMFLPNYMGKISSWLGIIHLVRSKTFRKTKISYPLIRTPMCVYQGVRNVSFSENFAYVLNECSLIKHTESYTKMRGDIHYSLSFEDVKCCMVVIIFSFFMPLKKVTVTCFFISNKYVTRIYYNNCSSIVHLPNRTSMTGSCKNS